MLKLIIIILVIAINIKESEQRDNYVMFQSKEISVDLKKNQFQQQLGEIYKSSFCFLS